MRMHRTKVIDAAMVAGSLIDRTNGMAIQVATSPGAEPEVFVVQAWDAPIRDGASSFPVFVDGRMFIVEVREA